MWFCLCFRDLANAQWHAGRVAKRSRFFAKTGRRADLIAQRTVPSFTLAKSVVRAIIPLAAPRRQSRSEANRGRPEGLGRIGGSSLASHRRRADDRRNNLAAYGAAASAACHINVAARRPNSRPILVGRTLT